MKQKNCLENMYPWKGDLCIKQKIAIKPENKETPINTSAVPTLLYFWM